MFPVLVSTLELFTARWKALVLVIFRSASLRERAELQHMHGYMHTQAWQHERAVQHYQQEFLLDGSGPHSSSQHALYQFLPFR